MKKIFFLLFVSFISMSAFCQNGSYSTLQVNTASYMPVRDTNWNPARAGAFTLWMHTGVDTSVWQYNGKKWVVIQGSVIGSFVTKNTIDTIIATKYFLPVLDFGSVPNITKYGLIINPTLLNTTTGDVAIPLLVNGAANITTNLTVGTAISTPLLQAVNRVQTANLQPNLNGGIKNGSVGSGGSGYAASFTYTNVPVSSAGGGGTTFSGITTNSSGQVISVTYGAPSGAGFKIGDTVRPISPLGSGTGFYYLVGNVNDGLYINAQNGTGNAQMFNNGHWVFSGTTATQLLDTTGGYIVAVRGKTLIDDTLTLPNLTTGTPAYSLNVDALGNVIRSTLAPPSVVGNQLRWTNASGYVTNVVSPLSAAQTVSFPYVATTTLADSAQVAASIPKYYGSIYNKNSWVSLTDFTQDTATAALTGNKIAVTVGSGYSSLDYNYFSLLEHWNNTAKIKVTSTSAAAGVGVRSYNVYQNFDVDAFINFATGTLRIVLGNRVSGSARVLDTVATSSTNLTISTNDYILISIERSVDTIYATARDITTGSTFVTATYGFQTPTYTTGAYTTAVPNTGKYCVYAVAGTFTLDSLSITSNELINSNVLMATDSKGIYTSNFISSRWPQLVSNLYYPSVLSVGPTDGVRDVLNRVPEIIALQPKKVLLLIGRNDVANSYNYVPNYDTIVAQLTRAGITVLNLNGVYETSGVDLTGLAAFINTTFPSTTINTYDPTAQVPGLLNADQVHPNQAGHNLIASTIIQSSFFKQGLNYADITRLSVPPFSYTYTPTPASGSAAGIVSLGNQTLGTGVKTMQEVATSTSFDLPATSSSSTGVITQAGQVIYHQYNGNSNFFAGYNAGNFTLSNYDNVAVGSTALNALTSGALNTAVGYQTLKANQTGSFNTAIGVGAGGGLTTGDNNTYVGTSAGQHATNNASNILIGYNAGVNIYSNANGGGNAGSNIMIGNNSGSNNFFDGSYNVVIGHFGLQNTTGIPNNKFCVTGGSSAYNILYGDFNTGQLQVNAASLSPAFTGNVAFEVVSTTGAMLPPRFTTTNKNALVSPTLGGIVVDTTLKTIAYYNGTTWANLASYSTGAGIASTAVNNFTNTQNTGGSNYTAATGFNFYNPSTVTSALTITMPAAPADGDLVTILFGGTIVAAAPVVTTLTVSGNSGQTVYGALTLTTAKGGDVAQYVYQLANTRWFRIK